MSSGPVPTILLVDDDEDCHVIYAAHLRHAGYEVLSAQDGEAGLEMAAAHLPALVVMDVGLPGIDGLEATRRIRSDPRTAAIPVVVLSAQVEEPAEERAHEAGCAAFLTKPCIPSELEAAIVRALAAVSAPDPAEPVAGAPGTSPFQWTEQDRRDELRDLYFEAGAGLYACQALEYALKYLIFLLSREGKLTLTMEDAERILDGKTKHTLGRLIQTLADEGALGQDVERALREGLDARNNLVHRYFTENVERMVSADERRKMEGEVRALRRGVRKAEESIRAIVDQIIPFHILSAQDFMDLFEQALTHGREPGEA